MLESKEVEIGRERGGSAGRDIAWGGTQCQRHGYDIVASREGGPLTNRLIIPLAEESWEIHRCLDEGVFGPRMFHWREGRFAAPLRIGVPTLRKL
mmetsp:Transcript_30458/g.90957  ORF Transcript_30458/g.90957 Transcript_30458/m.90957 type:complete len:95 (-) Transcript_30458:398-682(-)